MSGCRHPAEYRLDLRWGPEVRDGHEIPSCQTPTHVNICGVCLHWLPLGPAAHVSSDEKLLAMQLQDLAVLWQPGPARDEREADTIAIMAGI